MSLSDVDFLRILQQPTLTQICPQTWLGSDRGQLIFASLDLHLQHNPQDTAQMIDAASQLIARHHQYSDAYLLIVFDWARTHAQQPMDQARLLHSLISVLKSSHRATLARQLISLIFYESSWANPSTYQTLKAMRTQLHSHPHVLYRLLLIHLLHPSSLWQRQQLFLEFKSVRGQDQLLVLLRHIVTAAVWRDAHQRFSIHTRRQLSFFAHKKAAR